MKKHDLEETVVRIEVLLQELKSDIEEIKEVRHRLEKVEQFNEKVRGFAIGATTIFTATAAILLGKVKTVLGL